MAKFFTRVLLVGILGVLLLFAVENGINETASYCGISDVSFNSIARADGYYYRWYRWNRWWNYDNSYQYNWRRYDYNNYNQSYDYDSGPMYYNRGPRYRYWRSY